jgi:YfiH family protein
MQIRAEDLAMPLQVHGDRIQRVEEGGLFPATDGLITDKPALVLSVLVADCLSLYLYDPDRPAVGLVHAGWRGSSMNIIGKAVEAMASGFKSQPAQLKAWMGPSIGPCCYEVGEEVASQFQDVCVKDNHLDLWTCNRLQLESAGLKSNSIEIASLCTKCHPELFYSHRGSGGKAGRMMAIFGL